MSQPSVASFFNTRKRAAPDDINIQKTKVFLQESSDSPYNCLPKFVENSISEFKNNEIFQQDSNLIKSHADESEKITRSGRTIKRIGLIDDDVIETKLSKLSNVTKKQNKKEIVCQFTLKGNLSPLNKLTAEKCIGSNAFASKSKNESTPTKLNKNETDNIKALVRKELNFDEVKGKITRSEKLKELKSSLGRIKELEKIRKAQEERNKKLKNGDVIKNKTDTLTLKEFSTIDLEVLTSPKKGFSTPVKNVPPTPNKNELMSPKNTVTKKRLLFSPSKDGSPSKIIVPPAYQKYLHLTESPTKTPTLILPYKYRYLLEIFKSIDSVCAMFFNRNECITFKKLKPAVQRLLRKNFYESHLAQIKQLYPEAFHFFQQKTRNFGSTSKQDYFQLIIVPNVEIGLEKCKVDEDDIIKSGQLTAMNPQVLLERQRKFQNLLVNKVKIEHEKFLQSLDPPIIVPTSKIIRWHPEFDLENCADIEKGHLPQAPNIEKYSSAKDILSTARNLFNCATPMERLMGRLEAKSAEEKQSIITASSPSLSQKDNVEMISSENANNTLLKGVPKSLLEKIRAKQAAKALDAITRRPSQDQEATKYSRLPEIARHLRNVFITERKSVLTLEIVIKKIENSYRTSLNQKDIENHIKLIVKECPKWVALHEIRKTIYLKMTRDMDLNKIIENLENLANEKSK